MPNAVERYQAFRREIDARITDLEKQHYGQLACKPGCCECCLNLTVFPVEYHSILHELKSADAQLPPLNPSAPCSYLKQRLCVIYPQRPLICRTHGLPIAFLGDQIDPPEASVSFCPLNFPGIDLDTLSFSANNTLDIDQLNLELYQINLQFIEEHPEMKLSSSDRLDLRNLPGDLSRMADAN